MIRFDRDIYFDLVRQSLFGGAMDQGQVNGQKAMLHIWEVRQPTDDLRHLAYCMATALHETASTMLPIEEYGRGAGQPYGVPDKETGQTYYGRGFVQLTWRENYAFATKRLELEGEDDLEWHAEVALDPLIASRVMFIGMLEGWFRPPNDLHVYFDSHNDDAYGARDIINGDKHIVPSWSDGVSIGELIAGYHRDFLDALRKSSNG